jgi:hypothetical protein
MPRKRKLLGRYPEYLRKTMKKSVNSTLSLFMIFVSIFLSSCSSPTRLPPDANSTLEAYWQSLPSEPTLTYQILQVWPGIVPAETTESSAQNMDVWCVETEITAAKDASIVGETVTWIVIRNDEKADWNVAMLATMSSIWPYEACGNGP